MKKIGILLVAVVCLCFMLPSSPSRAIENVVKLADYVNTGKLLKGYVSDNSYVAWIVYDLGSGVGDEVWVYNLSTGAKSKIAGSSGYKTLSDNIYIIDGYVYWVAYGSEYKIYRYKLSGGSVSEYFNISGIGDLEKASEVTKFTMVNADFFEYVLKYSITNPLKQYNIATGKSYGNVKSDFTSIANGGVSLTTNKNTEIFWMEGDGSLNNLNVSDWSYFGGRYLFYTIDNDGALFDNYVSEYRLFDLVANTRTVLKSGVQPDIISYFSPMTDSDYVVVRQDAKTNEGSVELFLRFNYKTGDIVYPALVQNTGAGTFYVSSLSGAGSNVLWYNYSDSKTHLYYDVSEHQFCTFQKENIGTPFTTYKDFVLAQGGNTLYYNKVTCQGAAQDDAATTTTTTTSTGESQLIKTADRSAVYYKGADGNKYVFFNATHFYDWYADFKTVKIVSQSEMEDVVIGGNVTYRPGSLVKLDSSNKVYAVGKGGTLRWVKTEAVAKALWGTSWAKQIKVIPDIMFTSYKVGSAVESSSDFNPTSEKNATTTINQDKGL